MQRFYYSAACSSFVTQDDVTILGRLDSNNELELTMEQREAWFEEIVVMKDTKNRQLLENFSDDCGK